MITTFGDLNLKKLKNYADWRLLLFLLLFLDVKLFVKVAAIIIIYLLQFDFKFGFSIKNSRLPLFYPIIIAIAFFDYLINKNYTNYNYSLVLVIGTCFWAFCILAMHQVKLSVEQNSTTVIHRTIVIFFIVNAVFSFLNLAVIIWKTGAINPYTYQGEYQKYFIGTGDYIKGITFDTSTTNAILNAFGVIYFLTKKNALMVVVCMAVLLFTGSNSLNICMVVVFILLFAFKSDRDQKSLVVICLFFLVLFMAKISPQNNKYVVQTIKNITNNKEITKAGPVINTVPIMETPDSLLSEDEKKQKTAMLYIDSIHKTANKNTPIKNTVNKDIQITQTGKIYIPKPDIDSKPYQSLSVVPPQSKSLTQFITKNKNSLPISGETFHSAKLPGKIISILQTINFFKAHPAKIIMGDGMGNFSSKLAFRASGLGQSGGYPEKYVYINHDFLVNHLDLYLNFFSRKADFHSLTNSPYSTYDQLLAEYGIAGLIVFFVFYLGFFLKNHKKLSYGIPIILLLLPVLFIDYWFEQLSILVFFELIILLNIKESNTNNKARYGHQLS